MMINSTPTTNEIMVSLFINVVFSVALVIPYMIVKLIKDKFEIPNQSNFSLC